jgi:phosphomevalonate kinase
MSESPVIITSAPGKLMLTGEYAVVEGGPALLMAVSRRVVARAVAPTAETKLGTPSEFLAEVQAHFATEFGHRIVVDSDALYHNGHKLGLGSSAAVTVAAVGQAMAQIAMTADSVAPALPTVADIVRIASEVHAMVQARHGAAGSGADIAAICHGGLIRFVRSSDNPPSELTRYDSLPTGVQLQAFYIGSSASTTSLVSAVAAAKRAAPVAVNGALQQISTASAAACEAVDANDAAGFLSSLQQNADGLAALGAAAGTELETSAVRAIRSALRGTGCVVKTTGAGGGDIGIVVGFSQFDVTTITSAVIQAGCTTIPLQLDPRGVDIQWSKR